MENTNNELATRNETTGTVSVLSVQNASNLQPYCSMKIENMEDRKKLFNCINSPNKRVGDCINEVIQLKDVYIAVVPILDKETGEITECKRTVLIDSEGNAYQAVSTGIFNAVRNLIFLCGSPQEWEVPVPIKIRQITKDKNSILTFDIMF